MDDLKTRIDHLENNIGISEIKKNISEIQADSSRPDFWSDHEKAGKKMQKLARLNESVNKIEELRKFLLDGNLDQLAKELDKVEDQIYFTGPHFESNAILSIHSGQGGTEAMDWANMLYRMYARYVESKGWKWEEVDRRVGEEAGIKSVTITVSGQNAYGFLQAESGVHRLVRLSPFNSDSLRQTSFALVEVLPVIDSLEKEIVIPDDEIEWGFFRASGPGGQNVNKVSTAVRLTHTPTNIVITSQSQRSQHQNRETALTILKSKLWQLREKKRLKNEEKIKGKFKTPGWSNQIRSYVLHPYKMVKDLRTGTESNQADKVLNGDIDDFIFSYLKLRDKV